VPWDSLTLQTPKEDALKLHESWAVTFTFYFKRYPICILWTDASWDV